MSMNVDPSAWPVRSFRAMGCQMSARVAVTPGRARAPLREVEQLFGRVERALSRFDPRSELSRLNAQAGQWVPVSPLLWQVLDAALAMAEETNGLFDPTLLGALEAAGYTRTFDELAGREIEAAPSLAGMGRFKEVRRRPTGREVWLPPGARLDLGGIAKGWTAEQAARYLRRWGASPVDAGGDLAAGAPPPGWKGWPVAVAAPGDDPDNAGEDLAIILLANATLASSGVDFRRWRSGNTTMHHIIDPRTGLPAATDLLSVTIHDRHAVRAEAWATAILVQGEKEGLASLKERKMAALLVRADNQVRVTAPMLAHRIPARETAHQINGEI